MEHHLSIKAFSKLTGIECSTLRYWDKIGLFAPAYRNEANGYRFYTPDQIIACNFIVVLSELGIPLKTINEMTSSRTPETILSLLENQEKHLDAEIRRLHERYTVTHVRRELIKQGFLAASRTDGIYVGHLEAMNFIQGGHTTFEPGQAFHKPFASFIEGAKELRINLQLPIGAIHDNWSTFAKAPGQPEYYFSVDPNGNSVRPAGNYVIGLTRGYYGDFDGVPDRMTQFIEQNHLKVTGSVYTIYLYDEICLQSPSEYLSYVCIAIDE